MCEQLLCQPLPAQEAGTSSFVQDLSMYTDAKQAAEFWTKNAAAASEIPECSTTSALTLREAGSAEMLGPGSAQYHAFGHTLIHCSPWVRRRRVSQNPRNLETSLWVSSFDMRG